MMSMKRIIPCLDLKDGRVVKGTNFVNLRDAGDPVELAELYDQEGADELVLLDISATVEGRATMIDVVRAVAQKVKIPFSVGGGVATVEDVERLLAAGASKVGMNSAAIAIPELIADSAKVFGSEQIVVAIDAKLNPEWNDWEVYTHGGKKPTGLKALEWAAEAERLGAGEILLTSIDADGTKDGFDIPLTAAIADRVSIPIIASGGAGTAEHFYDVFTRGKADAGLGATVFHFRELPIQALKNELRSRGVAVR